MRFLNLIALALGVLIACCIAAPTEQKDKNVSLNLPSVVASNISHISSSGSAKDLRFNANG